MAENPVRVTVDGRQLLGTVEGPCGYEGELLRVRLVCMGCGGSGLVACHSLDTSYSVEVDECSSCGGSGSHRAVEVLGADLKALDQDGPCPF